MILNKTIRLFLGNSTDLQLERASAQLEGYSIEYERVGDYLVAHMSGSSDSFVRKVEGELKAILGLVHGWD